jgi:hypothetical protein
MNDQATVFILPPTLEIKKSAAEISIRLYDQLCDVDLAQT